MVKFIDLFSGIGGFHIALSSLGAKCVLAVEINPTARTTYISNFSKLPGNKILFNKNFYTDVTKIKSEDIPDFDVLCAGFPCQPFSNIGLQKGFTDTRGTLFFEIERILKDKQPKAFILENVRGLLTHDSGKTFKTIQDHITALGYSLYYSILKASDYGVPQNRPRLYMVGFRDNTLKFTFPEPVKLKITMSDILEGKCDKEIGYTLRVGGKASPIGDRHAWDAYCVNGQWIRINSTHAKLMQGFPKDFSFPVSESQALKQLGNAVAVPVVKAIYKQIIKTFNG